MNMAMAYEYWIGSRYVRSRSKNSFVSLISAISMLGIAIAVSVLIIVLSVVNGFERELKDRLLAMSSHAAIEGIEGQLENWDELTAFAERDPRVIAAAPYINGQALMVFGEQLSGTELRGIDPQQEIDVSGIGDLMTAGEVATLAPGKFNIVLGVELAKHLGVRQDETVAFGNSYEDVGMLRWAGMGVAVSGSVSEALDAADVVAPPLEEDGVSQVLDDLLDRGLIG